MSKTAYHHGDLASALLEAAEAELSSKGIEGLSLRAVAKRVGVSHGAPAHHFGDARSLLTALAAKGYERLLARQQASEDAASPDPRERLVASGLAYVEFAMDHPELFRLMFNSSIPDRTDVRFFDVALSVFDRLVRNTESFTGGNPYEDRESMLDLMASWSLVHGLAELIISGRAERPLNLSDLEPAERRRTLSSILARVNVTK